MYQPKKKGQRELLLYNSHGIQIKVKVGRHIKNYAITVGKAFLKDFIESRWTENGIVGIDMCIVYPADKIPGSFIKVAKSQTRNVIYDTHGYITLKEKLAKRKGKSAYKAKLAAKKAVKKPKKGAQVCKT